MIELTEADLLRLMKSGEDHFVERKVVGDHKDWKKTAVAFANSVPVGDPAVLFIGVRDNGEIETQPTNLDEAQKRFTTIMQKVYPRIFYVTKTISENGKQALAVIIPGSELRPHFAGLSYVRRGSQSDPASEEQFAELIAQRNSKTAKVLAWKGKAITVKQHAKQHNGIGFNETQWKEGTTVVNCDQFCLTLLTSPTDVSESFPLRDVEIKP